MAAQRAHGVLLSPQRGATRPPTAMLVGAMPRGVSWRQGARYRVDNALSRGLAVVLLWVGLALLLLVILVATAMWIGGIGPQDQPVSFGENFWQSLTRSLDPGTFGADEGNQFRIAGLIVTLGGLLAVSLVIGLISNAVDTRLDGLRRGRSLVVERGHTLVLGYSSKLPIVVRELMEADDSDDDRSVVVLTPFDKIELEENLRRQLPRRLRTRLVVRRGEPASLHDLAQVSPGTAAAAIVLRPDQASADAEVVRVVLALEQARYGLPAMPIVAELESPEVARALRQALSGDVMTVVSREFVARIAAQTARAAGLGTVYQELLDFSGDEFYVVPLPAGLVGAPFAASLLASETSTIVGVAAADGVVTLCPDPGRLLGADDQLIVIAADDSAVTFVNSRIPVLAGGAAVQPHADRRSASTLVVGWNKYARRILEEVDANALPGSELLVIVDPEVPERFTGEELQGLRNHETRWRWGSTIDRNVLHEALAGGPFAHILVLCAHEDLTPLESDARALLALMHVRGFLDHLPPERRAATNLVSEVLDPQSVEIARVARPDDFIVSQRLVSLYLAQLAENPIRKRIVEQLLSASGPEIALVPCLRFLDRGEHTYGDLIASAVAQGVVAIGWRSPGSAMTPRDLGGGIRVNPEKREKFTVTEDTQAIVLLPE